MVSHLVSNFTDTESNISWTQTCSIIIHILAHTVHKILLWTAIYLGFSNKFLFLLPVLKNNTGRLPQFLFLYPLIFNGHGFDLNSEQFFSPREWVRYFLSQRGILACENPFYHLRTHIHVKRCEELSVTYVCVCVCVCSSRIECAASHDLC